MGSRAHRLGNALLLALAACTKRVPDSTRDRVEPAWVASAVASAAPATPAVTEEAEDAGGAHEASSFSLQCTSLWACKIRGTVRAARSIVIPDTSAGWGPPQGSVSAIELEVEPDDTLSCPKPLDDPGLKPERRAIVVGGQRLAARLGVGAQVCGWTSRRSQAGLGHPGGWEGELSDATGKLLAAWSFAYSHAFAASPELARGWRFEREGPATNTPAEGGPGFFVLHERVRVFRGTASAVSVRGGEVVLSARDGTYAVQATSDLTDGPVRVYVGHHDSFGFAAVRLGEP